MLKFVYLLFVKLQNCKQTEEKKIRRSLAWGFSICKLTFKKIYLRFCNFLNLDTNPKMNDLEQSSNKFQWNKNQNRQPSFKKEVVRLKTMINLNLFFLKKWSAALLMLVLLSSKVLADEVPNKLSVIEKDVTTSSYYQLQQMARDLNIKDDGSRMELEDRIFSYYNITRKTKNTPQDTININDATKTEYFKKNGEEYIKINGGVYLEINSADGTRHSIKTDSIVYNQTKRSFTAKGEIYYEYANQNQKELFKLDLITFDLSNMDAILIDGRLKIKTSQSDENYTNIRSKTFLRNRDNVLIFEDVIATNSQTYPPSYQVNIKKLWLLGDGEWACKGLTLKLGEVPIFYIPYFVFSSKEMIFHPTLGYDYTRGFYVNTTVYFIGQRPKKTEQNANDFFSIFDSFFQEEKVKEPNGFYLDNTQNAYQDDGNYLKLFMDGYTSLGFFSGLHFRNKTTETKIKNDSSLLASIGFSKFIYKNANNDYTDAFINTINDYNVRWTGTRLKNARLPFRFGLDFKDDLSYSFFSSKVRIDAFSDPYYKKDFLNRSERLDIISLLFPSEEETTTSSYSNIIDGVSNSTSLDNSVSFSLNFPISSTPLYPYISQFNISEISASYTFISKTISEKNPVYFTNAYNNPEQYMYYPNSSSLPSLSYNISGTLLGENNKKNIIYNEREQLLSPFEDDKTEDKKENEKADYNFINSGDLGDLKESISKNKNDLLSNTLKYNFSQRMLNQGRFLSRKFNIPEDLNLNPTYYNLDLYSNFNLNYNLSYDNMLSYNSGFELRNRFKKDYGNLSELNSNELKNLENSRNNSQETSLYMRNTFNIKPLSNINLLANSSVYYNLNFTIFTDKYNYLNSQYVRMKSPTQFKNEFFDSHSLGLKLAFDFLNQSYQNTLEITLPPKNFEVNFKSNLNFNIASLYIEMGYIEYNSEYSIEHKIQDNERKHMTPINMVFFYNFPEWLKIKQNFGYDFSKKKYTHLETRLDLWFFYTSVSYGTEDIYTYNLGTANFVLKGEEKFRAKSIVAGISYEYQSPSLFKDRLKIEFNLNLNINHSFIKFLNSTLNFDFHFKIFLFEYFDFFFDFSSSNRYLALYIKSYAEQLGRSPRNFFQDLFNSLNIFRPAGLKGVYFNLNKVSLGVDLYFGDFSIRLAYSGEPARSLTNPVAYRIDSTFVISVFWNNIKRIARRFEYKDEKLKNYGYEN